MPYDIETVPHYTCKDCEFFGSIGNSDPLNDFKRCKRIDGDKIKFYKPPFSCRAGEWKTPCNQFEPWCKRSGDYANWSGFENFWEQYKKVWFVPADSRVCFVLANDPDWVYVVKYEDFKDGTMIEDGRLKAYKKFRTVACRVSEKHPCGTKYEEKILEEPILI